MVKFDEEKAGLEQRKKYPYISGQYKKDNGTPIFRQRLQYCISKNKSWKQAYAAKSTIYQFALKIAFAVTGLKIKAQTIRKGSLIVVKWNKHMPRGFANVMLSRAESIDDVLIAGSLDPQNDKTYQLNRYESVFAKRGRGKGISVFYCQDANIYICNKELHQFMRLKHEKNIIFCVYASKSCNFQELVKDLKDFDFNNEENTYLIGDLNLDASKTKKLIKYLNILNYIQIENHVTHLEGHNLDQVYISHANLELLDIKRHCIY